MAISVVSLPMGVDAEAVLSEELPASLQLPDLPEGWVDAQCVAGLPQSPYFTTDHADVLRLYWAFFNRDPDLGGALYWLQINNDGNSLDVIADNFALSKEFSNAYGSIADREFLEVVYQNVLGREYDQEGFNYWLALLEGGELTRGGVVRWVAANNEFTGQHRYPEETKFDIISVPGARSTELSGLNDSGLVAGTYSGTRRGQSNGFVRHPDGTYETFTLPGSYGSVTTLNNLGDIAGFSYSGDDVASGFLRTADGVFTSIDVPGSSSTKIYALNDLGDVAGLYLGDNGYEGFVREADSTVTTVQVPGAASTTPTLINNAGGVAGNIRRDNAGLGFVRVASGEYSVVEPPDAAHFMSVSVLNEAGDVAGVFDAAGWAFIRDADGSYTMFDLPGVLTYVNAMNDEGYVAGWFLGPDRFQQGFVRSPDGSIAVVPSPIESGHSFIQFLNNSGQVAGTYTDNRLQGETAFVVDLSFCER